MCKGACMAKEGSGKGMVPASHLGLTLGLRTAGSRNEGSLGTCLRFEDSSLTEPRD